MHRVLTNDATARGISRPTRSERASWLTYEPVDEDEEEGEEDEARVPHPDAPVDGGDAEEEEDDGLRAVGQHLHGVLDGRHWRLVHVGLDVALAGDAREHDAERHKQINKQTQGHVFILLLCCLGIGVHGKRSKTQQKNTYHTS